MRMGDNMRMRDISKITRVVRTIPHPQYIADTKVKDSRKIGLILTKTEGKFELKNIHSTYVKLSVQPAQVKGILETSEDKNVFSHAAKT